MSECQPRKIKNKISKKYISIGGKTFNTLFKDNKNDKYFNEVDLQKALNHFEKKTNTSKPTKPVVQLSNFNCQRF